MVHHRIYPFFNLNLEVKVTQYVAQYPLHCVTYATAKFEVATSNVQEIYYMTLTVRKFKVANKGLFVSIDRRMYHRPTLV